MERYLSQRTSRALTFLPQVITYFCNLKGVNLTRVGMMGIGSFDGNMKIKSYPIFRAASFIASIKLFCGIIDATGILKIFSTVGLTIGAQTSARAPSRSA
jgi:hypothetical protein